MSKIYNIDRHNRQNSNAYYSSGNLEELGIYTCMNEIPLNFMISGDPNGYSRYLPLQYTFNELIGRLPIVVLHDGNSHIEDVLYKGWIINNGKDIDVPLWLVNQQRTELEPFYGMTEMQVVACFRQIALKLEYKLTPKFDKIVRAHLDILKLLDIEISLSGLYYLSQFKDMVEFQGNVMEMEGGLALWAALNTDEEDFELFRSCVDYLAYDASQSGWNQDNTISHENCISTVKNNAVMSICINPMYDEILLRYFAEEIRAISNTPFLLIIDNVLMNDNRFREIIRNSPNCYIGIVAKDAINTISGEQEDFSKFAEKINSFILFKSGTGDAANRISEIMGNYDHLQMTATSGTSKETFSIFSRDRHQDVSYSTENRKRVMPEDIISLGDGQAIVFDAINDVIIYYN